MHAPMMQGIGMLNRYRPLMEAPSGDGTVIGVDSRKQIEQPFMLVTDPPDESVVMAANQSVTAFATLSNEGPMEITRLAVERTGACRITLSFLNGEEDRTLMNAPIHVDTILGSGAQPYILPEAFYLHERRGLSITWWDISGSANAARGNLIGAQYLNQIFDPRLERIMQRFRLKEKVSYPYWYTFNRGFVSLGAGLTANVPITINTQGHFLLTHISGVQTGEYSLDILDATKGESIFDTVDGTSYLVPRLLIMGTNNFPFRFEQGILFEAGSKILVRLLDTSGSTNVVNLTLGGIWLEKYMWR